MISLKSSLLTSLALNILGVMQFSQGAEVDAGNGMGPDATLDAAMSVRVPSCIWFVRVQGFQHIVPDILARPGWCKGGSGQTLQVAECISEVESIAADLNKGQVERRRSPGVLVIACPALLAGFGQDASPR